MSAVYPTFPRLAVRDSGDDDDLTDIDDEVFIRDGRNGSLKLDDDGRVKRPLMAPRRKYKKSCAIEAEKYSCRAILLPFCYGTTALVVLIGLIVLCIFTANVFPMPLTILKNWMTHELKKTVNNTELIPCTSLSSKILWTRSIPKLTSEAALRSIDVNGDGIQDIIVGFGTGLDTMDAPEYICSLYFGGQIPCLGGVLALDGKSGEVVWSHGTPHAVFSIDCGLDITGDKIQDCVISGRGGILRAISGHDGSSIWEMPPQDYSALPDQQRILDVYDARFIPDRNGDEISDVIASHAVQSGATRSSTALLISGKTGSVINTATLPDTEQLFISPLSYVHPDGEVVFVLATSSQQQSGGLYVVPEVDLFSGNLKLRKLHHGTGKGALLPPIFVDLTSDGTPDIVAAMFNSTIMAYNGLTFDLLWNYTVPNSEVISIPIPGYYNDDDIPDFMVKHQIGSGFPTYYYTVATVIDGRDGQPLLETPIEDSLSRQMSGLSVTVDGFGNDWFLHWTADCLNYEGVKEKYQFLKGESLISQARADLCKLRFNSTLATKLLALSQHVGPPGIPLYYSEDWKSLEYNNSVDPRAEAEKYLEAHPDFEITDTYADILPLTPEKSQKNRKGHQKNGVFGQKDTDVRAKLHKYPKLSGLSYQSSTQYKEHNKPEYGFEPDNPESFNVDGTWKDRNKWPGRNVESDKEYDVLYDGYDNDGTDEAQADYIQEVREQRSEDNDDVSTISKIGLEDRYILNKDVDDSDIKFSNYYVMEPLNRTNISDGIHDNVEILDLKLSQHNHTNISKRKRETNNMIELAQIHEETMDRTPPNSLNTTQSNKEELSTKQNAEEVVNDNKQNKTLDLISVPLNDSLSYEIPYNHQASISNNIGHTNIPISEDSTTASQTKIYSHNFPNDIQSEQDASIEKVFKRESLKNRKYASQSTKLKMSRPKRNLTKLRKERTKRSNENNQDIVPDGVQRQPPTGILLPSISPAGEKSSIDLVFSTFWLPSPDVSIILLQEDLDCIHRKKVLSESKIQYNENDEIVRECLSERGVDYKMHQEATNRENIKVALGQMTIYRMQLECVCPEDILPSQTCKQISQQQSWHQHLGLYNSGFFASLRKAHT